MALFASLSILANYYLPLSGALGVNQLNPASAKKIALGILVIPAGIAWLSICILGLIIFGHAIFRDLTGFFVTLLAVTGLFSVVVAFIAVFKFPYISKLSVYVCGLGSGALIVGLYMGFVEEPIFLYSSISLFIASMFLLYEYVTPNKQFNKD